MTTRLGTTSQSIFRKSMALLLGLFVAIGSGLMLMAPAAWADQTMPAEGNTPIVDKGTLIWGVNEEWRKYITGGIAKGQITAGSPATVDSSNRVTWADASGKIDPVQGTGTITYRGSMLSQGHQGVGVPADRYALDQKFTDMQIELTSPTTAKMSAIVDQPGEAGFPQYNNQRVELAELEFSNEDLQAGQVIAKAVFTASGADVFARTNENYQPGKAVDDVHFGIGQDAPPTTQDTPKKLASISVKASSSTVYRGETVTITASVTPQIAGTVVYKDGNGTVLQESALQEGKVQLKTNSLPQGDHTIRAEFTPDSDEYSTAADTVSVSVIPQASGNNSPSGSGSSASNRSGVQGSMQWGVKQSFRSYVTGNIAQGKITPSGGATQASGNGSFTFPQASRGTSWNGTTGTIQYAGNVNFYGHNGVMDVTLSNPVIVIDSASSATVQTKLAGKNITLANIDLASGKKESLGGEAVRYSSAPVKLASQGKQFFSHGSNEFYATGTELDRITLTIGDASKHNAAPAPSSSGTGNGSNTESGSSSDDTAATNVAQTAEGGSAAGSLKWGVSDYFAAYTTEKAGSSSCPTPSKHCAGGTIETSGVGEGWLFPQATGSDWDESTDTGTVNFSGLVAFKGYGMTMFQVSNPSITVRDASTATLHTGNTTDHGQASYPLNLAAGTKTENANGSVTWSNVPVQGALGGISASQSIDLEPLTFTVGTANDASFGANASGSGSDSDDASQYEAADTPPTTEGLEILTDPDKIREGGRIKVRAEGFDAEDSGVLVVLYEDADDTEPILLDDTATADSDGVVEWSGTLPDKAIGDYVMTLQGSSDAGAKIDIKAAQTASAIGSVDQDLAVADQQFLAMSGMEPWEWWTSAASLMSIAGCTSLLTLRHRRNQLTSDTGA